MWLLFRIFAVFVSLIAGEAQSVDLPPLQQNNSNAESPCKDSFRPFQPSLASDSLKLTFSYIEWHAETVLERKLTAKELSALQSAHLAGLEEAPVREKNRRQSRILSRAFRNKDKKALISNHADGNLMQTVVNFEVYLLSRILKKDLNDGEWAALQSAHLIGLKDFIELRLKKNKYGPKIFKYTFRLIDRYTYSFHDPKIAVEINKAREAVLSEAGFTKEEIQTVNEIYGFVDRLPGFELKGMAVLGRELTTGEVDAIERQSRIGEFIVIGGKSGPVREGYTWRESREKRNILKKVFTSSEIRQLMLLWRF